MLRLEQKCRSTKINILSVKRELTDKPCLSFNETFFRCYLILAMHMKQLEFNMFQHSRPLSRGFKSLRYPLKCLTFVFITGQTPR